MSQFILGSVRTDAATEANGKIKVMIKSFGKEEPRDVFYVSPYKGPDAGFFAPPPHGTEVIIAQLDKGGDWYYFGSVYRTSDDVPGKPYGFRPTPQEKGMVTPRGQGIVISDSFNPKKWNMKTGLKTGTGKGLDLEESPYVNSTSIKNRHGDGLTLSEDPNLSIGIGSRSMIHRCEGAQRMESLGSTIDICIEDGRDINIKNNSTGTKAPPESTGESKRDGNVNLESEWKDVNITVGRRPLSKKDANGNAIQDSSGSVFIEAIGASSIIQIDSNAKMIIHATGDIEVRSEGTINMVADKDINIASKENVNIDGVEIHLNEQLTTALTDPDSKIGKPIKNRIDIPSYGETPE